MVSAAEYVSVGHPDSTADAIASYLLDEFISHDPKTRFALEVQLKDHICNLAGEITSRWDPSNEEIADLVREAIRKIGYRAEYAARWPDGATLNADKVKVNNFIGQQSPDIAQGVDREGWGDQGIMMGMATNEDGFDYLPRDIYFARRIGKELYEAARDMAAPIGLDIKTLVSLTNGLNAEQIIVAAPIIPGCEEMATTYIKKVVTDILAAHHYTCDEIIINGTGSYVIHSSIGDAGVVGRKLAVNFYGLNCPIGGGSPFGKDPTKADVTLNLYARYLSLNTVLYKKYNKIFTKIVCCIGLPEILVSQFDENNNLIAQWSEEATPADLIRKLELGGQIKGTFFKMCTDGLFSIIDEIALAGD